MGRKLDRNQSILQFEKSYKGCILGLLPLQLQSFKKFMPLIKQKYEKASKSEKLSKPSLTTESKESDDGQVYEVGSSDSRFTAIGNIYTRTPKEGRCVKGKVPARPRLTRTYSIHHLEPENNCLDGVNADQVHPVVIHKIYKGSCNTKSIPTQTRTFANENLLDDKQIMRHSKQFGEHDLLDQTEVDETYEDFFDAFQIDKKLLMKSTQNPDVDDSTKGQGAVKYPEKVTFKRFGSFPVAPYYRYGGLMPSNLESKLTEVWPSNSSSSSSSTTSPSLENNFPRSYSCQLPMNIFGELAAENDSHYETDPGEHDYASDVRRYKLSRIRRSTSLNESLERYTQLYDTSFKKDPKLNFSKSLRVSNGDEVGFKPYDSVYLRKVQSTREVLQVEWLFDRNEFSGVPNKSTTLSINSEQADTEVNTQESLAGFQRQVSCCYAPDLKLPDELQIKCDFDQYLDNPPQLDAEDIKPAPCNQDNSVQERGLGTDSRVIFSYEQTVFNILEALKTGNSTSTALNSDLDKELLFDLVNEALLDVYSIFDAYWPTPLCVSSSSHMHPLLNTEHHVTRSVLTRIQKLKNLSQKTSNITDNVVSYDLAQAGDVWMNLQADAESFGLALDEMIFDELIDELMFE